MPSKKWDKRYLQLAQLAASWSKDPSTKVGAAIVKNNRIVSIGFNGIAMGLDDEKYLETREIKYRSIIHAELNARLTASGSVEGATVYITHPSCSNCVSMLIQSGIERFVWIEPKPEFASRWDSTMSIEMIMESGKDFEIYNGEML